MLVNKTILVALSLLFLVVFSSSQAETLTFNSSVYEGEVKKGKAHGEGVLTFSDETTFKGKFKKNKPHGVGVYTDARENTYEGKWRFGKLKVKIDKKTRKIIKLSTQDDGQTIYHEIKGIGTVSSEWFEAEEDSSGVFTLTKKGKRDMKTKKMQAESGSGSGSGSNSSSSSAGGSS
jgi:hypothetical protein